MPRIFKDFSDEVVQGSSEIKQSLDSVRGAADEADKAHGRLADAQKNATQVADDFAKKSMEVSDSLRSVSRVGSEAFGGIAAAAREFSGAVTLIGKGATDVSGGISDMTSKIDSLADVMSRVSRSKIEPVFDISATDAADKTIAGVVKSLEGVDKHKTTIDIDYSKVEAAKKSVEELMAALGSVEGIKLPAAEAAPAAPARRTTRPSMTFDDDDDALDMLKGMDTIAMQASKKFKRLQKELELVKNLKDDIGKKKKFELQVQLEGAEAVRDFVQFGLDKAALSVFNATAAVEGLDKALEQAKDPSSQLFKDMVAASGDAETSIALLKNRLASVTEEAEKARFGETVADEVKKIQKQLILLEADAESGLLSSGGKEHFVRISIQMAGIREFEGWVASLDEAEQNEWNAKVGAVGLEKAMAEASSTSDEFRARLKKVSKEAANAAEASRTYTGEVEKARKVTNLLNNSFQEGVKEAKAFAGGLGVGNGMMMAAGVGMFLLMKKTGELIDRFKDARMELARFNVDLALLQKRSQNLGFKGNFNEVRKELNLTRKQATEFYGVLRDGALSGVASVDELVAAATKIQDTFGGDPTEKLKSYVELLKQIPTLETDLSITASLDDKAAAVFDLARTGKVEAMIDLQSAGLLGGVKVENLAPEEKELLKANQKTEKTMDDIYAWLQTTLFPAFGPQLSAIADSTFKVFGAIGGLVAVAGIASTLLNRQISAQNETTEAVRELSKSMGKEDEGVKGKLKGLDKLKSVFKKGGTKGGVIRTAKRAAIATVGPEKVKEFLKWSKAVKDGAMSAKTFVSGLSTVTKVTSIAGIAFTALGFGAKALSKVFDKSGNEVAAAGSGLAGELLIAAGTVAGFAALGSVIPGVGTALGTAVGVVTAAALVGATQLENIGRSAERFGKSLQQTEGGVQKFSPWIRSAGVVIEGLGKTVADATKRWKAGMTESISGLAAWSMEFTKSAVSYLASHSLVIQGLAKLAGSLTSDEYKTNLKNAGNQVDLYNAAVQRLHKTSAEYTKVLQEDNARTQASALALQRELGATKQAFESGKMSFANFSKEVAMLDIRNLSELGGTSAGFSRAIEKASGAVNSKFKMLTESLVKRREEILANTKIEAVEREQALTDLHEKELKAAKEFADGMSQVIDALFKTPALMKAGLEREMAKMKFDFRIEGGVGADEFFAGAEEQVGKAEKVFKDVYDAADEAAKRVASMEAEAGKAREIATKAAVEQIAKLPEELKKKVSGVVKPEAGPDGKPVIDTAAAAKAADEMSKESDRLKAEIDKLRASMDPKSFSMAALEAKDASLKLENLAESIKSQQEALEEVKKESKGATGEKAEKAAKDIEDKEKALLEAEGKRAALQEKQAAATKTMSDAIEEQLKGVKDATRRQEITNAIIEMGVQEGAITKDAISKLGKEMDEAGKVLVALGTKEGKNAEAGRVVSENMKKLDEVAIAKGTLDGINDAANMEVKATEERKKILEQQIAAALGLDEAYSQLEKASAAITKPLQREVDTLKAQEEIAKMTGDGVQNLVDARMKEAELAGASVDAIDRATARITQGIKDAQDALAKLPEGDARRKDLEALIGRNKNRLAEMAKMRNESVKALGAAGDEINAAMARFKDSLTGKRLQQTFDMSTMLGDLAEFSDRGEEMMAASAEIARKAANERAKLERAAIDKSLAAEEKLLKERVATAAKTGGPKAAAQVMQEGKITLELKKRTEYARIELEKKRQVLEAAQKEADYKMQGLDLEMEGIQAEMDFISDVGGSFDAIVKLQGQGVEIEKAKLAVLEEQLAKAKETGEDSRKIAQLELAVKKQGFAAQKAAMGAQKSILDRFLGAAMGGIEDSIGAARRRGSDVGLLGREKTQVVGRGGLFLQGKAQPMAQRAAQREMSGFGKQLAALGQPAKRLKIEEEIAAAAEEGKDINEVTAKATGDMRDALIPMSDAALKEGSLYVHDSGVINLLTAMLGVMQSDTQLSQEQLAELKKQMAAGGEASTVEEKQLRLQNKQFKMDKKDSTNLKEIAKAGPDAEKAKLAVLEEQLDKAKKSGVGGYKLAEMELGVSKQRLAVAKDEADALAVPGTGVDEGAKEVKVGLTDLRTGLQSKLEQIRKGMETGMTSGELADLIKSANEDAGKVNAEENAVRLREVMNPIAGAWETADVDRIAAGKAAPEVEELAKVNEEFLNKFPDMAEMASSDTFARANEPVVQEVTPGRSDREKSRTTEATMKDTGRGVPESAAVTEVTKPGGGPAQAGQTTFKVTGEIMVRFDNRMFKDQVTTIVGEVIQSSEIQKTLDKRYLSPVV